MLRDPGRCHHRRPTGTSPPDDEPAQTVARRALAVMRVCSHGSLLRSVSSMRRDPDLIHPPITHNTKAQALASTHAPGTDPPASRAERPLRQRARGVVLRHPMLSTGWRRSPCRRRPTVICRSPLQARARRCSPNTCNRRSTAMHRACSACWLPPGRTRPRWLPTGCCLGRRRGRPRLWRAASRGRAPTSPR